MEDKLPDRHAPLDRHVLATTIWFGCGVAAAVLLRVGFGDGGAVFVLAGFAVLLAAFVGHVVVNAVYASVFTPRELALGLVLYGAALVAFGLAVLVSPEFRERDFLPTSLGFLVFGGAVMLYLVLRYGLRSAFDAFDVVREFGPGSNRRGGRNR